jgi:hypothetical protein
LPERWFSEETDIRNDAVTGERVSDFLRQHQVRSVVVADGIIRSDGQLAMLKVRVLFGTAQKEVEKAFDAAGAELRRRQ